MDESLLGRRLRCERERRLITLESIAVNTKISIGLLRDLERDDVSRWPSGIFRRSFVRTYAEAIGLDGDDIVREFLERYPDAQQHRSRRGARCQWRTPKNPPKDRPPADACGHTPKPFSGGQLLKDVGARIKAVGWDCLATLVLAAVAFLILGAFWIPFALVTVSYYAGGILILGNSPGVCLFAPKPHDDPPQDSGEESLDDLPETAPGSRLRAPAEA